VLQLRSRDEVASADAGWLNTYAHDGTITHRDDQGNVGTIHAGDVQAMRAGTGISHSERNDEDSPARLFQIWLRPKVSGCGACGARWPRGLKSGNASSASSWRRTLVNCRNLGTDRPANPIRINACRWQSSCHRIRVVITTKAGTLILFAAAMTARAL